MGLVRRRLLSLGAVGTLGVGLACYAWFGTHRRLAEERAVEETAKRLFTTTGAKDVRSVRLENEASRFKVDRDESAEN